MKNQSSRPVIRGTRTSIAPLCAVECEWCDADPNNVLIEFWDKPSEDIDRWCVQAATVLQGLGWELNDDDRLVCPQCFGIHGRSRRRREDSLGGNGTD
jgi:hypothetical protein